MSKVFKLIKLYLKETWILQISFYISLLLMMWCALNKMGSLFGILILINACLGIGVAHASRSFSVGYSKGLSIDFFEMMKSFPLNKSEALIYGYAIHFLSAFPLIFAISGIGGLSSSEVLEENFFQILLLLMFITLIITFFNVQAVLQQKRKQYQFLNYFWQIISFIKGASQTMVSVVILFSLFLIYEEDSLKEYQNMTVILAVTLVGGYYFYRHRTLVLKYEKSFFSKKILTMVNMVGVFTVPTMLVLVAIFGSHIDLSSYIVLSQDPISRAIMKNDLVLLRKVIKESKVDINQENKHGYNPYMVAVHYGNVEILKILEENGAKPTLRTKSALHSRNDKGMNVFLLAVDSSKIEMINYIKLKYPESVDALTDNGSNALHIASRICKDNEVLGKLIEMGIAKVDDINKEGNTPTHIAAYSRCFGNIMTLNQNKADFTIANIEGKKPVDLFRVDDSGELKNFIERAMRKPASLKNN